MLGMAMGFFIITNAVIWPNYYGRRQIGSIRGVATTVMVASAALGPLPFAFLFEMTGSYSVAIVVFLALPILCILAALAATPPPARLIAYRP